MNTGAHHCMKLASINADAMPVTIKTLDAENSVDAESATTQKYSDEEFNKMLEEATKAVEEKKHQRQ